MNMQWCSQLNILYKKKNPNDKIISTINITTGMSNTDSQLVMMSNKFGDACSGVLVCSFQILNFVKFTHVDHSGYVQATAYLCSGQMAIARH